MRFDLGATTSEPVRRFTLYLPGCDRDNNPVKDIDDWIGEARLLLCMINGGVTRLPPAQGVWFCEDTGNMIREPVHIIYSSVKPDRFMSQIGIVRRFIERFGRETNQDTVAAEFDGRLLYFRIPPTVAHAAM